MRKTTRMASLQAQTILFPGHPCPTSARPFWQPLSLDERMSRPCSSRCASAWIGSVRNQTLSLLCGACRHWSLVANKCYHRRAWATAASHTQSIFVSISAEDSGLGLQETERGEIKSRSKSRAAWLQDSCSSADSGHTAHRHCSPPAAQQQSEHQIRGSCSDLLPLPATLSPARGAASESDNPWTAGQKTRGRMRLQVQARRSQSLCLARCWTATALAPQTEDASPQTYTRCRG